MKSELDVLNKAFTLSKEIVSAKQSSINASRSNEVSKKYWDEKCVELQKDLDVLKWVLDNNKKKYSINSYIIGDLMLIFWLVLLLLFGGCK